ncbi:MAG: TIGR03619 family F420-dependent LLM class oxidoreductase [Chloroflexi bacterium]|nr:TIGR03619 family F420-dependent LLM class oxidoreductase [Chloroflexota bacterium]
MKFGINIINFGPHASPESLRADVQWSEDVEFYLAMVSDHVAVTPDVARLYPAPFYEPFTTLAWLAGLTSRIELGTTVVILPYRHPLLVARIAANLDQFSGGRLVFGVGVGWARAEFDALGVPFDRRGQLTDDYLEVLRAHWTQDVAAVDNRSLQFRDVDTRPLPVRRPHPPIWVGGNSTAAIRRASRYGEGPRPLQQCLRLRERRRERLLAQHVLACRERGGSNRSGLVGWSSDDHASPPPAACGNRHRTAAHPARRRPPRQGKRRCCTLR